MNKQYMLNIEIELIKLALNAYRNGSLNEEKRLLKLAKKIQTLRGGK